ncbi:MAG: hypothetical protein FH753_11085 [Firmicutes bacterium]|nr:hypothetical protein [Bacillota bacterium]
MEKDTKKKIKEVVIKLDRMAHESLLNMHFRPYESVENKADYCIMAHEQCIKDTKKELYNRFNYDEIAFLLYANVGRLYSAYINMKEQLIRRICIHYNYSISIGIRHDVDIDTLLEKVDKLTVFQSYVLIYMILEFLDFHGKKGGFTNDDLKKTFKIIPSENKDI